MSESLPPEKGANDRAFGVACWTLGGLAFVLLLMVGGNLQSVQRIGDWMDVDAAFHVFRDGSPVNQPPGIGVVAFNAFCFRKLGLAGWGC